MYGAVPPKMKRPDPQDSTVEMQPLMVDPYFDKNFAPEPSTFSAFKLAAVISTIAIILVIGIAVSSRGQSDERSQTEKTDPFFVNKITKMMMPNGWIRLRAATSTGSEFTKPTGFIFLSQYEYGAQKCDEETIQIQHGTVTGMCVAGQDIYGDVSTSGVYTCSNEKGKVVWEFQHFNSTDCTGESLKVYRYEYPSGCSIGDKVDSEYVFQAGCSQSNVPPYSDMTTSGYLLGSAITDENCDAGDEFYYSWVKTDACLKGLDSGQGSRKFTECSGMAVTVSLYADPLCATEEYSSVTSFECDVTDDYFYYYYDDSESKGGAAASGDSEGDDQGVGDDGATYSNQTYYADDAENDEGTDDETADDDAEDEDDKPADDAEHDDAQGDDKAKAAVPIKKGKGGGKSRRRRRLNPSTRTSSLRRLSDDKSSSSGTDEEPSDDDSNTDDLAIFRNYVFGKCLSQGPVMRTSSPVPPTHKMESVVLDESK